jgi:hypothetical protein
MTQSSIDDFLRQQDRKAARLSGEHTTPKVHDFHESLKRGENARLHAFWDEAYQKHFPTVQKIERFTDMQQQRSGRDARVILQGGEIIHVQEKSRDRDDDSDIALEFEHRGDRYHAAGWVELDLQIHYLAYAFVPIRKVYFLPWHQLRLAWIKYGEEWKSNYFIAKAKNKTYVSYSVCVPTRELRGCIARMAIVQL